MSPYKKMYNQLRWDLYRAGVGVLDLANIGFATHSRRREKFVVYVCPGMSWKLRLFVLAHEAGHVAVLGPGRVLRARRSRMANEEWANYAAVRYLSGADTSESTDVCLPAAYAVFYGRFERGVRYRAARAIMGYKKGYKRRKDGKH